MIDFNECQCHGRYRTIKGFSLVERGVFPKIYLFIVWYVCMLCIVLIWDLYLRRRGGAILLNIGNQGTGVDFIVPDIILIVAFSWMSILLVAVKPYWCTVLSYRVGESECRYPKRIRT